MKYCCVKGRYTGNVAKLKQRRLELVLTVPWGTLEQINDFKRNIRRNNFLVDKIYDISFLFGLSLAPLLSIESFYGAVVMDLQLIN